MYLTTSYVGIKRGHFKARLLDFLPSISIMRSARL